MKNEQWLLLFFIVIFNREKKNYQKRLNSNLSLNRKMFENYRKRKTGLICNKCAKMWNSIHKIVYCLCLWPISNKTVILMQNFYMIFIWYICLYQKMCCSLPIKIRNEQMNDSSCSFYVMSWGMSHDMRLYIIYI